MAILTLVHPNDTACAVHELKQIELNKEALKVKALEMARKELDNSTKSPHWYKPAVNIGSAHPTYQDNEKTGSDKENDLVFGLDYRLKNNNYRNMDDEKSLPARKQYIYAVSDNIPLYVQYSNNCINLIQSSNWIHYNMQRQHKLNYDITDGRGVYVVDYYRFSHISQQLHGASPDEPYHRLMKFYSDTDVVLTNDKVVNDAIKNCMARKATDDRDYIRVITFIPLDKILDNNVVFVPSLGLVFGTGNIFTGRVHPYSDNYYNFRDQTTPSASNYVSIDIVDNENNDVYFTKVGNKVVRLNSTADKTRHDGVRVEVFQNNIKESSEDVELKDIEKVGVYKSRMKAEYNGDTEHISKVVELRKIEKDLKVSETDLLKSENELIKTDMNKDNLIYARNNMYREETIKQKTHDMKIRELKLEAEYLELSYKDKIRDMMIKQAINKLELEQKIYKFKLEVERDMYKFHYDVEAMKHKGIYDKGKFGTDILSFGIGAATKLLKFV